MNATSTIMHTDESWAAHREHRARYDALHAKMDKIKQQMESPNCGYGFHKEQPSGQHCEDN